MKDVRENFRNIDIIERAQLLDILDLFGEYITIPEIKLQLWDRARKEQISFEQTNKLANYLLSDDFFCEVEPLLFYYYKDGTDRYERRLDHIYRRSITPIHVMN